MGVCSSFDQEHNKATGNLVNTYIHIIHTYACIPIYVFFTFKALVHVTYTDVCVCVCVSVNKLVSTTYRVSQLQ